MSKKICMRSLVGVLAVASIFGVNAADLGHYAGGQCSNYRQSYLHQQPVDDIRQSVSANLSSAKVGMGDPRTLTNSRPAFVWAMEARWACSAALGYLNGGHVDEETVQKCDCFHQQYLAFR
ncbi:hypothetical protein JHL21_17540 [Devosia sp. WQ 349]|uniref:hypothetical protein n=1 Tax=Devosia sp. WQ 349K1 TaxID=2800329 RepID=UPI00190764D3|nr:hypothetical protein [Devosia sp. WQ 349K1]MBK1796291.1 hypothetical protein [Devosia sp. WQ 349K1]